MNPVSPVIPSLLELSQVTYAKDQPEYVLLPAWRSPDGLVVTRWKLSWRERLRILFSGSLWLSILTFNKPLQPVRLAAEPPLEDMQEHA